MSNPVAQEMIKRHEGVRPKMYLDTKGIPTIGVGRNIRDKGLSDDEIELMFTNDLKEAEVICVHLCPSFCILSQNRQAALMDMAFMGSASFSKFKKLFTAIALRDWDSAASEAKKSKWYSDVGSGRGDEVYNLLLKG